MAPLNRVRGRELPGCGQETVNMLQKQCLSALAAVPLCTCMLRACQPANCTALPAPPALPALPASHIRHSLVVCLARKDSHPHSRHRQDGNEQRGQVAKQVELIALQQGAESGGRGWRTSCGTKSLVFTRQALLQAAKASGTAHVGVQQARFAKHRARPAKHPAFSKRGPRCHQLPKCAPPKSPCPARLQALPRAAASAAALPRRCRLVLLLPSSHAALPLHWLLALLQLLSALQKRCWERGRVAEREAELCRLQA